MRSIVERHCNNLFWRAELWAGDELLWWTSYEDTRQEAERRLREMERYHRKRG